MKFNKKKMWNSIPVLLQPLILMLAITVFFVTMYVFKPWSLFILAFLFIYIMLMSLCERLGE